VDDRLRLVYQWRSPILRSEPEYHLRPSAGACKQIRAVATGPSQLATGMRTSLDGAEAEITAATAVTIAETTTVTFRKKDRAWLHHSPLVLARCPTACPTFQLASHSPIQPTKNSFHGRDVRSYLNDTQGTEMGGRLSVYYLFPYLLLSIGMVALLATCFQKYRPRNGPRGTVPCIALRCIEQAISRDQPASYRRSVFY
jgi:hypothetical protein